jgi:hypothetical protein
MNFTSYWLRFRVGDVSELALNRGHCERIDHPNLFYIYEGVFIEILFIYS